MTPCGSLDHHFVSESLGKRNIPSDEHAYIGIKEHSYINKCSDQNNQNSSPFTDCARSFAFWQGLKESVDICCILGQKILYIVATVGITVGRSGQRYIY